MTDWLERIDRTTGGVILAEHIARYALARPIIATSAAWIDLGCGTAVASRQALEDAVPDALFVDIDETALGSAQEEFEGQRLRVLQADLSTAEGVATVAGAAAELPGEGRCVTCFETIEHLSNFVPLIGWLVELADADVTTILSVPNDAHSGVQNPYHETVWGDGAVRELRTLLPDDHRVLNQVPLTGSSIAVDPPGPVHTDVELGADRVPSHFLIAFGPAIAALETVVHVHEADLDTRLRWERQREADLSYYRQREQELSKLIEVPEGGEPIEARTDG